MAILFDWYENPVSPDQPKKKRFHPRIAYNGHTGLNTKCGMNEM